MLTETQIHAEAAYRTERAANRGIQRASMRHGLLRRMAGRIATASRRSPGHRRPATARPAATVNPTTRGDLPAAGRESQPVADGISDAA